MSALTQAFQILGEQTCNDVKHSIFKLYIKQIRFHFLIDTLYTFTGFKIYELHYSIPMWLGCVGQQLRITSDNDTFSMTLLKIMIPRISRWTLTIDDDAIVYI
jgi:hypothetical protein